MKATYCGAHGRGCGGSCGRHCLLGEYSVVGCSLAFPEFYQLIYTLAEPFKAISVRHRRLHYLPRYHTVSTAFFLL